MPDLNNDIDAMLRDMGYSTSCDCKPWRHDALTALVAERNALRERVAELEESTSILRWRVTTMLAEQQPAAIDLRDRLVCAALTGVMAHPSTVGNPKHLAEIAVAHADAAIAAMRKGDECNR